MNEEKVTIGSYVERKLSQKISELEIENAKLEFLALKYKQDAENVQKELKELKEVQNRHDSSENTE